MTHKTTIMVDGDPYEIDASRLTLLYSDGERRIEAPDMQTIDPAATVAHATSVAKAWPTLANMHGFMRLYRMVYGKDATLPTFEKANIGHLHVVGLILLLRAAAARHARVIVKHPESYLHPKLQAGLGDLLIDLTGEQS